MNTIDISIRTSCSVDYRNVGACITGDSKNYVEGNPTTGTYVGTIYVLDYNEITDKIKKLTPTFPIVVKTFVETITVTTGYDSEDNMSSLVDVE